MDNITFSLQHRQSDSGNVNILLRAFCLNTAGRVSSPADILCPKNNQIAIDLQSLPRNITRIVFAVILSGTETHFGDISGISVLIEDNTDTELAYPDFTEYSIYSSLILGELVCRDNEWRWNDINDTGNDTLEEIAERYGVENVGSTPPIPPVLPDNDTNVTANSLQNKASSQQPRRVALPPFRSGQYYICPHCFEEIPSSYHYECSVPSCRREDGNTRNFEDRTSHNGESTCDVCGKRTKIRLCPHQDCHGRIPNHFEEITTVFIGIVGAARTGKTHFLTTLIEQLRRRETLKTLGLKSVLAMGRTKQRYAEYFQTLFIDRQLIPTTQVEIMHPLLYLLEHPDNSVKKAFNLVFFDAAGEHYDNVDNEKIREYHRYLANAAGIILLLDPNGRESIPQMHLLDKLVEDMESFTNTESVPLAVTLSKADEMAEFMSYFSAEMPAYTEDWNRNSKRVKEWFGDDRRIVNVDKFRTDFFAVSALGKVPVEDKDEMGRDVIKIPNGPSPIHVIDPLLWILSEQHLI